MTALKREAIQLVEQMPYVIQYINTLKNKDLSTEQVSESKQPVNSKMAAFLELEKMLVPILPDLDYDKELSEARNEKYGYTD